MLIVFVGNIFIRDNVLIVPRTFVDFYIHDYRIVIGNPEKIIKKENTTDFYVNNIIWKLEIL